MKRFLPTTLVKSAFESQYVFKIQIGFLYYGDRLKLDIGISRSRLKRKEGNLWQRRFWEHLIRDEVDFANHCDYIHYNPVKHKLCESPQQWAFSSIHRLIKQKIYPSDWAVSGEDKVLSDIWDI